MQTTFHLAMIIFIMKNISHQRMFDYEEQILTLPYDMSNYWLSRKLAQKKKKRYIQDNLFL